MLTGKSTPEVWKPEHGFSFLFYMQFWISGCLVEQKWIWDLFWCGLDSGPVWTDLPALLYWSGRPGGFGLARSHSKGTRLGSALCMAPSCKRRYPFALFNFLGDGMDLASFAFTWFFSPDQNNWKKIGMPISPFLDTWKMSKFPPSY